MRSPVEHVVTDFYLRVILIAVTFWMLLAVRPTMRFQLLIVGSLILHSACAIALRTNNLFPLLSPFDQFVLLFSVGVSSHLLWIGFTWVVVHRWRSAQRANELQPVAGAYQLRAMSVFTLGLVAVEIVMPFVLIVYWSNPFY